MKAFWISFRNEEYKIVTQVKKQSLKLSITVTTFYGFWARLCVWIKFLHLNDFSLAVFVFFFLFLCFFHIKKSKKKWYAYLHYYDNFKSCLNHYRVPDKVQTALCSEFFHCVLSTSALLNGGNFILWVSLRLWDHLRSILFKEHTHTHHISIYLWNVKKRLGKQQTSVSHSRWKSPFWPESSCQEWTELA